MPILEGTTEEFNQLPAGPLVDFINVLLPDGCFKIRVDHVDGDFIWEPSNYMQLPATNDLDWQNLGQENVDVLVDFTNSVFQDKGYQKVLEGEFVLQGVPDDDDEEDADPHGELFDNGIVENDPPPPINPVFSEAIVLKCIIDSLIESNATATTRLAITHLQDMVLQKLERDGMQHVIQGLHLRQAGFPLLSACHDNLNLLLSRFSVGAANIFHLPGDGTCYVGPN